MIISIHQPGYLPWLGYFARIMQSDLHIVLDHVSFEKNSFINRNRVLTSHGPTWLTVPVKTKGKHGQPIFHTEIANQRWQQKHLRTIKQAYSRAPYLEHLLPALEAMYGQEWKYLTDLLSAQYRWFVGALGIVVDCPASCGLTSRGHKTNLIINICNEMAAWDYLSGPQGVDYLDMAAMGEAGIEVTFDDWTHPEYQQLHKGFEPNMSVLDLLMNHGPRAREIMMSGMPVTPEGIDLSAYVGDGPIDIPDLSGLEDWSATVKFRHEP